MASKNQNKPPVHTPSSPSSSKYNVDEVSVDKRRRVESTKIPSSTGMRTLTRQAFSVVNGGHDQPPTSGPPSVAGSDCGVIELTKEDTVALLNEKLKIKNKYNYKDISEQRFEYIKRLKQCIKWFQQLEGNYITEQEKLNNLLELAEKQFNEMESLMKAKEEELNSIIMELRKNLIALQEKFTKEESDKMEALDSLAREKDDRAALERLQASLSEELKRTQQDNASSNQKVSGAGHKCLLI
ncbi:Kinesin-3 [Abeliophyllum distichum]|uniref:Kinesin-3 n=1 Tax=Abeliophyllum distichum TaxID=126358 RepID=A0ABD1NQ56_9LAMI